MLLHNALSLLRLSQLGFSALLFVVVSCACGREKEHIPKETEGSAPLARLPSPGFSISKSTEDALFTWVDKDGSYQITSDAKDIPLEGRKQVRVVVDGYSAGSASHVFVVDLSELDSGVRLKVSALTREDWESMGKAQRDARVAALAPKQEPKGPSPADLGVDAIVYGAEWCKPCHLAEDYLKKKGARVVKKDIEETPSAGAEMRKKLKSAGMGGSSIPVLDVGGTILRGFSERAIDSALKRATK